MDEFDHCREWIVGRAAVAARTGCEDNERGTQPFAPAIDDVLAHLPDQNHIGMQAAANDGIHRLHFISDQALYWLQRGGRHCWFLGDELRGLYTSQHTIGPALDRSAPVV